jgi:hypothetical protein
MKPKNRYKGGKWHGKLLLEQRALAMGHLAAAPLQ